MAKVRVQSFAVSIDGFGAGPHQDMENPLGINGESLFPGIDFRELGYRCTKSVAGERATHIFLSRSAL